MTPSLTAELRSKLVVAYLGHRLNNHELVDLLRRAETPEGEVEDTFADYTKRDTDWRHEVSPEQREQALERLGLTEQYRGLDENKVWTSEDRALYRRLSQPEFDPPTDPPAPEPAALHPDLLSATTENFGAWSRDGDLALQRQELDFLLSGGFYGEKLSESNDPHKAAVLATLLRYQSLLEQGNPHDGQGITGADLQAWHNSPELIATGAMAAVNETFREYLDRAKEMHQPRTLLEESVHGGAIYQGVVGSCVLLSTTAGTAQDDLRRILGEATNNPDSFKVEFADGKTEEVAAPSLAARLHHSQGQNGERWPAILEIAAAQRLSHEKREAGGGASADGLRGVLEGIDPEFAIPAMTGQPADKRSLDTITLAQTRELLGEALAPQGPVICGSRPTANGDFINEEELHNGIANGHCYRVKSFDPTTDKVTLQNPWHKGEWNFANDGNDDGVFEMPLHDFYSSFRWVTFAKQGTDSQKAA